MSLIFFPRSVIFTHGRSSVCSSLSDLQPGNHVRALNDMRNQSEKVFVVRKVEGEAVFLEDTERSMTSDSILRTIDPCKQSCVVAQYKSKRVSLKGCRL